MRRLPGPRLNGLRARQTLATMMARLHAIPMIALLPTGPFSRPCVNPVTRIIA